MNEDVCWNSLVFLVCSLSHTFHCKRSFNFFSFFFFVFPIFIFSICHSVCYACSESLGRRRCALGTQCVLAGASVWFMFNYLIFRLGFLLWWIYEFRYWALHENGHERMTESRSRMEDDVWGRANKRATGGTRRGGEPCKKRGGAGGTKQRITFRCFWERWHWSYHSVCVFYIYIVMLPFSILSFYFVLLFGWLFIFFILFSYLVKPSITHIISNWEYWYDVEYLACLWNTLYGSVESHSDFHRLNVVALFVVVVAVAFAAAVPAVSSTVLT